jgi:DNA-binding SARP family transcriptional activator
MRRVLFAFPGTRDSRNLPGGGGYRAFGRAHLMRFRMLGPLEVLTGEGWSGISAAKWRALLACLLLRAGQVVPTESLIFELWGDAPPPTATNLISIYVLRLRRAMGDAEGRVLVHRKPGYQLMIAEGDTDLSEFESLVAAGRRSLAAGDAETAAALLGQAEGLWRGGFLADVPPSALVLTAAERSGELRLAATELRVGAELACGHYAEVIPELRSLVGENPLREGLWLLLMRALDGAGRHAEALDVYGQARTVIAGELGVDPGPELHRLYVELLAADARPPDPAAPPSSASLPASKADDVAGAGPRAGGPGAAAPDAAGQPGSGPVSRGAASQGPASPGSPDQGLPGSSPDVPGTIAIGAFAGQPGADGSPAASPAEADGSPLPRPAQLPADIGDFTGREPQVRHLADMLTSRDAASGPGAVRIAVVAGTAGLGKTTLAVHAAHQVRSMFPDGQLYVDLSGASADPPAPGEVLARFLRDLGVAGDRVPAREDERAALYRTRLTGRRVLVLLDNAKDAAQVRPLLPGSASCAVLVTTRNRTPDLASTRFVDLNVLSDSEALELFSRIVGDGRPAAEPDATAEILLACAGLPLAIRICAARLAARRQWRVATLASRLRDERRRLDELHIGDLEVRASFQVSYDSLSAGRCRVDPARVFRLLGLWQGTTISLAAAAALAGEREDDVADALETLVDANLLESPAPDRYRFHDLLRVYATERAQSEEPGPARDAAVSRLLRWYLGTAEAVADTISPRRYRVPYPAPLGVTCQAPEDVFAWYDDERMNVKSAIRQAAAAGLHDIAWRLATALFPVFNRRGNWTDCIAVHRIAVSSARAAGNRRGEACALQNLGAALARMRDAESLGYLEEALVIRSGIRDFDGETATAISLADAYYKLRGAEEAFEHSRRCLTVLREARNDYFLAMGLNNHADICLELGKLDEAAECLREALRVPREVSGYVYGYALHNLGRVYLRLDRPQDAVPTLTEAHRAHVESGSLLDQALTLRQLGEAQCKLGEKDMARRSWNAALMIFRELREDDQIAAIESALAELGGRPA